jgi:hypothetical protein
VIVYRVNKPSALRAARRRPFSFLSALIPLATAVYFAEFDTAEIDWQHLTLVLALAFLGVNFFCTELGRATRRQRIILTKNTLAIHHAGGRARFVRRDDCVALADGGRTLILNDGTKIPIWVDSASPSANEGFLKRLYALSWPGLRLSDVREKLKEERPSGWRVFSPRSVEGILFALLFVWWNLLALSSSVQYMVFHVVWCAVVLYFIWLWNSVRGQLDLADDYTRRNSWRSASTDGSTSTTLHAESSGEL